MEKQKICPECGSKNNFLNDTIGELLCKNCGTVIEDNIVDLEKEWRNLDSEKSKNQIRGGAPINYSNSDIKTNVGNNTDLKQLNNWKITKISKLNNYSTNSIERNLKSALSEIRRVCAILKLSNSVEEETSRIYTFALRKGLTRGRSMEAVVAASLYAGSKRFSFSRTLDEISEASGITRKDLARAYRQLLRELHMSIIPSDPTEYVHRFATRLLMGQQTISKAIEIIEEAQNLDLTSGRGPTGIAAAALYVAGLINGEKRTQREVADAAGVTEVTIRNRYKELLDKLNFE